DNCGAEMLVKNPVHHSSTTHVDVLHHFIRECNMSSFVVISYIYNASDSTALRPANRRVVVVVIVPYNPLLRNVQILNFRAFGNPVHTGEPCNSD
ncbi:uncharacterized protein EI90DRAFT_2915809, partial [Cantharellus anzutake]|uniref:uncharacterized protein n=1 Tax=Cantharellus anzutake TaxID=1750568 RepID=UPI001905EBD0